MLALAGVSITTDRAFITGAIVITAKTSAEDIRKVFVEGNAQKRALKPENSD
jgi:hypothetical protein